MLFAIGTNIGDISPGRTDINGLPFAGAGNVQTLVLYFIQPAFPALPAEIAFHNEGAAVFQKNTNVIRRVIAGIQPEQQGLDFGNYILCLTQL